MAARLFKPPPPPPTGLVGLLSGRGGGVGGRWKKKLLGYTQLCFFLPEGLDRVHNTLLRLAGVTWP